MHIKRNVHSLINNWFMFLIIIELREEDIVGWRQTKGYENGGHDNHFGLVMVRFQIFVDKSHILFKYLVVVWATFIYHIHN